MNKSVIKSIAYCSPLILLMAVLIYNNANPRMPTDDQLAPTKNSKYRKLQSDWLTNQFSALYGANDITLSVQNIPIKHIGTKPGEHDNKYIHDALGRIVKSLVTKTFDEYLNLRSVGSSFIMNEHAIDGQKGTLYRFHKIKELPAFPIEIHKLYWKTTTENGSNSDLWAEASWSASWIEFKKEATITHFKSTKDFTDILVNRVPNCGVAGYASTFDYSPTPDQIYEKHGHIYSALGYLLIKTKEGKSYPLIVQFYWAPSIQTWLPTHLAVGYVGNRFFDPVF